MLEDLCDTLVDSLRPLVLGIQDIDSLCELVHILSTEIMDETVRPAGAPLAALGDAVKVLVQDTQERLTYRGMCYIRVHSRSLPAPDGVWERLLLRCRAVVVWQEAVQDFKPSVEHLEYPGRLVKYFEALRRKKGGDTADDAAAADAPATDASIYDTWYPTLQRTLLCLSKMYRCVEVRVASPCTMQWCSFLLTYTCRRPFSSHWAKRPCLHVQTLSSAQRRPYARET